MAYDVNGNITGKYTGPTPSTLPYYEYYGEQYGENQKTNRLKRVISPVKLGGRNMNDPDQPSHTQKRNFGYDANGNMVYDKSKKMRIEYDWRNLPTKFLFYSAMQADGTGAGDPVSTVTMIYDPNGNRVGKIEK